MGKTEALAIFRRHQDALRARGVRHAALFGSVARGEAGPRSDVDVLIELAPDTTFDVFSYAGLMRDIADLFDGPVDVVDVDALKPDLRRPAAADAIYAF